MRGPTVSKYRHITTYPEDDLVYVWSAKDGSGTPVGLLDNGQTTTTVPTNTWTAPVDPVATVYMECKVVDLAVAPPGEWGSEQQESDRNDPDVVITVSIHVVKGSSYSYDANGNLKSVLGDCGITTYSYDLRDRPTRVAESDGKSIEYEYDNNGNRTKMIDHFNGETTYLYNDRNLVTKVTDRNDRETDYAYNSGGLLTRIDYPNGTYTEYTYTARNWTDTIVHRRSYNTLIASFDYDYDATSWGKNGTRTKVTEAILKPDNLTYIQAVVEYEYDDLYHLTSEVRSGVNAGVTYTKLYAYDAVGNRMSMIVDGGNPVTYDYNRRNQMREAGSATYTYHPDGNMNTKTDGGVTTSYIWSVDNKLVEVKEGSTTIAAYRYDGRRLRCQMSEGTTVVGFYYDGEKVIEEVSAGILTGFYGGPEVFFDSAWRVRHSDALGGIRAITSTSAEATDTFVYDAYGNQRLHAGQSSTPYQYAGDFGYHVSASTGYYLLTMRYYDPEVGRFVSADPLGYIDGFNSYEYVRGMPTVAIDPAGTSMLVDFVRSIPGSFRDVYGEPARARYAGLFCELRNELRIRFLPAAY